MKKARLVRKIVIGVVLLLVVVVLGSWVMIDSLAKKAVQQGGEYALGVPTTVDTLTLSLLGGSLRMDKLNVANPTGYNSAHLMRTGRFDLAVRPASVFSDTVEVSTFELKGLDLNIEAKGLKNNIEAVLDHIKKLGGESTPAQPSQQQGGGGKKIRVNRIVIRDVVAHVLLPIPGSTPLMVKVPTIELNNVGSDKPLDVAELIGRLMPAILAAVLEQGKGIIPADLLAGLQANVAGTVAALGGQATQMALQATNVVNAQVAGALQQVEKSVPAVAQQAVGEVSHQAQGALQNVQNTAAGSLQQAVGGAAGAVPGAASQPADQKKSAGKSLEGLLKGGK